MDLTQRKLSKSEWNSVEIPVISAEKDVLNFIIKSYSNVNLKYNANKSLLSYLKIDWTEEMESYLYNTYFAKKIQALQISTEVIHTSKPTIKKADIIRIERNDPAKLNHTNVYELLLLDIIEKIISNKNKNKKEWIYYYFTLFKLNSNNILHINKYFKQVVANILSGFEAELNYMNIIENAVNYIEKNAYLLKYADTTLYTHQKQIFSLFQTPTLSNIPKLVLYIAPTGTGKTLTPIGLSENYRVIFVCAARHVGLALAKSSISVNKKIAFAFGCASAADIRLHYFAAKEFTTNKRTGGIGRVDNSIGDKVEIMICDIKSYLYAMYYMLAFNPADKIITYWDEPTISMDYESHELHAYIKNNWKENVIPNIVLSSATLPKLHELNDTIIDFKKKFVRGNVHEIMSHDCKKTIPIISPNGTVVLPHYLSNDYDIILQIVDHCLKNLTLMRYLDLKEVIEFISFIEKGEYISNRYFVSQCFESLNDITMQNIKLHYLNILSKICKEDWIPISTTMKIMQQKRIVSNNYIDPAGTKITKSSSFGAVPTDNMVGKPLIKMRSVQVLTTLDKEIEKIKEKNNENSAIYITTKDSYTLTDGPTIYLAENVEKIAKFCIQQANIPIKAMSSILEKIEYNNKLNEKIAELEKDLEEAESKNGIKTIETGDTRFGGKNLSKKDGKKKEHESVESISIKAEIDALKMMIKCAELNETFIPNKSMHIRKWAPYNTNEINTIFTSDIDEKTIMEIMMLSDVNDTWKILLLMGIGVFASQSIIYTEIMKKLADQQKLYIIIASSDYIYGTNYQFCHGYLGKDLCLTQEKMIQALGRIGRNNIQQTYSVRLRDEEQIQRLFYEEKDKIEVKNMNQ